MKSLINFKTILLLSVLCTAFMFTSCTENQRVKSWGGEGTIELPKDTKLVNITWKGDEVWYLTRPMRHDEKAETYRFHEESSFGVMEGTYVVKETKSKPTTSMIEEAPHMKRHYLFDADDDDYEWQPEKK